MCSIKSTKSMNKTCLKQSFTLKKTLYFTSVQQQGKTIEKPGTVEMRKDWRMIRAVLDKALKHPSVRLSTVVFCDF